MLNNGNRMAWKRGYLRRDVLRNWHPAESLPMAIGVIDIETSNRCGLKNCRYSIGHAFRLPGQASASPSVIFAPLVDLNKS
jgi:hypothetical protein